MRFLLEKDAFIDGFMYNLYDEQCDVIFRLRYPDINRDKEYVIESTGELLEFTNKPTPWLIEIQFEWFAVINHSKFNKYDLYEALQCLIKNHSLWVIPETFDEYQHFERIAINEFSKENLIDRIISIYPSEDK